MNQDNDEFRPMGTDAYAVFRGPDCASPLPVVTVGAEKLLAIIDRAMASGEAVNGPFGPGLLVPLNDREQK